MRALLQRVRQAQVTVGEELAGAIGPGILAFLGVEHGDTEVDARVLADKTVHLRIFPDDSGRFNRSILDVWGALLVVSQFTLLADTRRGHRPSFTAAAPPEIAQALVNAFIARAQATGLQVASGRFGAHMVVRLENDGPVTLLLQTKPNASP